MHRSLTFSSSHIVPACRSILHPTSRFVIQSMHVIALRQEYLVGTGGSVYSVLLNSHRNYTRSLKRSQERPRYGTINDSITRNKKIIHFGEDGRWREILQLYEREKDQFSNVNWATAFSQLGRINNVDRNDSVLVSFVKDYAHCFRDRGLEWTGIRGLANVVHAIGKMQINNSAVASILVFITEKKTARRLVQKGNTRDIANIAWALAKIGVPYRSPGNGVESRYLFNEIKNRAFYLVTNGSTQAVSNTAWAFAKLKVKSPKLFAAIGRRANWLVKEGNTQELANTAWAFATLEVRSLELFAAIETVIDWLVLNGKTQELSIIAWSYAKVKMNSVRLFTAIEKRIDLLVQNENTQDIASTAWAFATLDVQSPKLFTKIESRADWLVQNGNTQEVATTIWAASQFQYYSPNLIEATNLRGAWLVKEGNIQDISNTAIAFAVFGYDANAFFEAVANNISKLINFGAPQGIINVCYAMTILNFGKRHPDAFCQLWNRAIDLDPERITNEALIQLHQVFALCTADGMHLRQPSDLLTQKIKAAFSDSKFSKSQREIAHLLGKLGLDCEEEVSLHEGSGPGNGISSIDIACRSRKLAIEYDGESHFLKELHTGKVTRRENGATKAKRRFLEQRGWNVINIDYQDWMDAEKQDSRLEFLRERLQQGGIQL